MEGKNPSDFMRYKARLMTKCFVPRKELISMKSSF